jgi:hypothetical protein
MSADERYPIPVSSLRDHTYEAIPNKDDARTYPQIGGPASQVKFRTPHRGEEVGSCTFKANDATKAIPIGSADAYGAGSRANEVGEAARSMPTNSITEKGTRSINKQEHTDDNEDARNKSQHQCSQQPVHYHTHYHTHHHHYHSTSTTRGQTGEFELERDTFSTATGPADSKREVTPSNGRKSRRHAPRSASEPPKAIPRAVAMENDWYERQRNLSQHHVGRRESRARTHSPPTQTKPRKLSRSRPAEERGRKRHHRRSSSDEAEGLCMSPRSVFERQATQYAWIHPYARKAPSRKH